MLRVAQHPAALQDGFLQHSPLLRTACMRVSAGILPVAASPEHARGTRALCISLLAEPELVLLRTCTFHKDGGAPVAQGLGVVGETWESPLDRTNRGSCRVNLLCLKK